MKTEVIKIDQNNMDTAARVLVGLPGLLLRGCVNLLRAMDYFGLLPRFLTNLSPFHGSMFITNMGSLGMPPIFHHLYNFGNLPVFIAMGAKRTEYVVNKNGEVEKKRMLDFQRDSVYRVPLFFFLSAPLTESHNFSVIFTNSFVISLFSLFF